MTVEWRVIPSFDYYEVSEFGDVRRCKPVRGSRVGKVLRPAYIHERGYRMYILRRNNRSFHRRAHQLVAEAFLGPAPFKGAEVCHKDGSKTNDHYSNLRWGSSSSNKRDMLVHGTMKTGEKHPWTKLSRSQVEQVFRLRGEGLLQREIASRLGVNQSHISKLLRGVRRQHDNDLTNQRPDLAA